MKTKTKTIIFLVIILLLVGFIYFRYYFVFGYGEKAGTMNYFVKKGYLFKTYEGRLIQNGIRIQTQQGNLGSNEFMFSVTDEKVAQQLKDNAGAYLVLHYKEYNHSIAWRGFSEFVVDSVLSVSPVNP